MKKISRLVIGLTNHLLNALLVAVFLAVLFGVPMAAAAEACRFDEQEGCFSMFPLAVEYDGGHRTLARLVANGPSDDLSDGLEIFGEVKDGKIERVRGCFTATVYAWNLRPGLEPVTYDYRGDYMASPSPVPARRTTGIPPVFTAEAVSYWGVPVYDGAWEVQVCDGLGAWQVGWDRIDPANTLLLVCAPLGAMRYPHGEDGLWIGPGHWPNYKARGLEGVIVPLVW